MTVVFRLADSRRRRTISTLISGSFLYVAKTVCERRGPSFCFSKDMFGTAPIFMVLVSEIETVTVTGIAQRDIASGEKHGIGNIVFLAKFLKERICDSLICGWLKLCI